MKIICHCGNAADIEIPEHDKRGYLCDACGGLFDVNTAGEVIRSPLNHAVVIETGVRYEQNIGKKMSWIRR